jgi:uncharacterized protein involved in outer membrane biogenesis
VRKLFRIMLWTLAVLSVLAVGLFAYLRSADLSVYQDQIEAFASRQIGHELSIDGRFELYFGGSTRIVAEDVSLLNPEWVSDPVLVHVDHLTVVLDFWSLFSSPFVVESLTVRGFRSRLETTADGEMNWVPPIVKELSKDPGEIDLHQIAFRIVQIDDSEVVHISPGWHRPVTVSIESLSVSPDANDILDLDLNGYINDLPMWADGKLGPWRNFLDGRDISADLDLTLGRVKLTVAGSVENLPRLEGVEIDAELGGPDIGLVLDRIGLPPFATGEFRVESTVHGVESGIQLRTEGNFGEIDVFASGNMDHLLGSRTLQLDFNIGGPDSKYVAELFGVKGAPAEPFRLTGDMSRNDRELVFENTQVQVGPGSIMLNGSFDFTDLVPDTNLTITASGPDFSFMGPFLGVSGLPSEPFTVNGNIQKTGSLWQANNVSAVVGENRITANGSVRTGSEDGAEIELRATGPDISILQNFTDLQGIPARPFDVRARVQSDPAGIKIEEGVGVFGDNRVSVDGIVAVQEGMAGTSLQISMQGPELHNVALLTGVPYLPDGPFEIGGGVRIERNSVLLETVDVAAGDLLGSVSGQVGLGDASGDFDLNINLSGPDTSRIAAIELLQEFTGEPFAVVGHVRHRDDSYDSEAIRITIGGLESELQGRVFGPDNIVDVSVSAKAADAEVLRKLAGLKYLPGGGLSFDGEIELTQSDWKFSSTELRIGDFLFSADGQLSLHPKSNSSDLGFGASGPSLNELGRVFGIDILKSKSFDASGQFNGTPSGFAMRNLLVQVGENNLHGEFDIDLREKPRVSGSLSSTFLDVTEGLQQTPPADEGSESKEEPATTFVFSDEPLNTSLLQSADIDVDLSIDTFITDTLSVTDLSLGFRLQDGALSINPIRFREEPGSLDGSISLVPLGEGYSFDLSVLIDQVHLSLLASPDQDVSEIPPLGGRVTLRGEGNSVHEIMASSNGEINLRHGSGKVLEVGGSQIFGDIVLQVLRTLNPLQRKDPYRTVDCGIYDVVIADGIATIDTLVLQTSRATMVATGQLNLRNEKLNIAFRSKPREGIGVSLGTVVNELLSLGGTLRSPSIAIDAMSSVTTTGVAVATGGLSLLARGLWDRVSAEASICEEDADPN